MPTDTFFNLPSEKRERLMHAIYGELARVPFAAFSVNRVVREADVSRGSFYQYFGDRDDLYEYLLSAYHTCMRQTAEQTLKSRHGDVFATVLAGFDESVRFACEGDNIAMLKHLFSYREPSDFLVCRSDSGVRVRLLVDELPLIDRSLLRCDGDEDVLHILEILLSQLILALAALFDAPAEAETQRAHLVRKLALLKRGLSCASIAEERNTTC